MSKKYAGENTIQEVISKTKALAATKLPNYSITINHNTAGNPRHVKFLTINYTNYTSNAAAYLKMGAMSCHGNGSSYQFLEDIIIGCSSAGTVVCNVYKYVQQSCGEVDSATRYYGDVYYTIDTTNKIVDFYILCGQYASSQFTPFTKIGSTTTSGITQYSGTASYYSSGDKVWATGNGATYMRTNDTLSGYLPLSAGSSYPLSGSLYSQDIFMYGGSRLWFGQSGLQHPSIGILGSSSERYIHFNAGNGTRCATMHTYALKPGSANMSLGYSTSYMWKDLWLSGSIKDGTNSVSVADIVAKQDALTFDTTPTANSTNPVTSGGIYTAISSLADTGATSITTSGSGNAVTSASYDATTRQITLTKGITFPTGTIPTKTSQLTNDSGFITTALTSITGARAGYLKFSNGLMIQWGRTARVSDNGNQTVTFSQSFSAIPSVATSSEYNADDGAWNGAYYVTEGSISTTGFTVHSRGNKNSGRLVTWIAIGYKS